jgi:hypothetical protein
LGAGRSLTAIAAVTCAGAACSRLVRRSGATSAEVAASLPGDDLVARPTWQSTRAITVAAPAASVWPWIVQMGYPRYRAGWYTPYWLDRLQWGIRERSAERVRWDLQNLKLGDRVPDSPDWSVFFTVKTLEPERALVLYSTRHLLKPIRSVEFSWAFILKPSPAGATRLIIRARTRSEPRVASLVLTPLIGIGDFLNASSMLRAIKRRSEDLRRVS